VEFIKGLIRFFGSIFAKLLVVLLVLLFVLIIIPVWYIYELLGRFFAMPTVCDVQLWRSIDDCNFEQLNTALDFGADINRRYTDTQIAVKEGRARWLTLFKWTAKMTPLEYSLNRPVICFEAVKILLKSGADATLGNPLIYAVRLLHNTNLISLLLESGAVINPKYEWTPLHEAVVRNDPAIVKFLLEHGADPSVYHDQETPLTLALIIEETKPEIIDMLNQYSRCRK